MKNLAIFINRIDRPYNNLAIDFTGEVITKEEYIKRIIQPYLAV